MAALKGNLIREMFSNKTILITGGTGSLGRALVAEITSRCKDIKRLVVFSRDELKQSEGDPQAKRRRQQFARQVAMQRISSAVPTADVIVTNPDHISVAIRYDIDSMHAPVVVAMGVDHLALRIRQLAVQNGVPIIERKPLARLLHATTRVGQEIPPDTYAAVAEVLAYVYRLSDRAA